MEEELPAILITSSVEIKDLGSFTGERELAGEVEVVVERAPGAKCQRCWNYRPSVDEDAARPGVCDRCASALESIGR
jgi:isoleucyl-tRNA synthetase